MKKLIILMLGLSLAFGAVATVSAQDTTKKAPKKKVTKTKGKKAPKKETSK